MAEANDDDPRNDLRLVLHVLLHPYRPDRTPHGPRALWEVAAGEIALEEANAVLYDNHRSYRAADDQIY